MKLLKPQVAPSSQTSGSISCKATVIILNYNGKKFLQRLFDSLFDQTFKHFEIIFIDNGSTDDSVPMLRDILSKRSHNGINVKIVLNGANLGYCRGNNIGLKYAVGEYVAFINNDAYFSPTWLEELVSVMSSFESIGVCQSRLVSAQTNTIQADGWVLDEFGGTDTVVLKNSKRILSTLPFYVAGTSLITRSKILQVVGGFDPFLFSGDFDLCWRIRLLGYDVGTALKSICYHYGQVATHALFSSVELQFSSDKEFLRVFLKNFSGRVLLSRLCTLTFRMFMIATYLSFKERNPIYFLSPFSAISWNLKMLRNTLMARIRSLKGGKVCYHKAERKILRGSIDISRKLKKF